MAFPTRSKSWQLTNSLPPRPMPAWVRLTVTEVLPDSRAMGWVANAKIEEQPGSNYTAKVFILHPPDAQYRRWLALTQRVKDGNAYIQGQTDVAASLRSSAEAYNQSGHRLNEVGQASGSRQVQGVAQERYRQAIQKDRQAESARRDVALSAANVEAANKELAKMGIPGAYTLDVFALRNGRSQMGLPVYDLGSYKQPK